MTGIFTAIKRMFQKEVTGNLLKITVGPYNLSDDLGFIGKYHIIGGRVRKKVLTRYKQYPRAYELLLIPLTNVAKITYKKIGDAYRGKDGQEFVDHIRLIKKIDGKKVVLNL